VISGRRVGSGAEQFRSVAESAATNSVMLANDIQTNRILFHTPNPTVVPVIAPVIGAAP